MDDINVRIINLMTELELNKTSFAKELQVSLPLITHITSGRNKAGLDIIQKVILRFDQVNPDWLINGNGDMLRMKPAKPDHTEIYNTIDKIKADISEQKSMNETIKSYHKILMDEIKHLEEMKQLIESSSEKLKTILDELEDIKHQLVSK